MCVGGKWGERMGMSQPSHKMTNYTASFPEQKYTFSSQFSLPRSEASKAPPVQTTLSHRTRFPPEV